MSTISKRVSKYLLARQQRAARLNAFGKALDAGILERTLLGETERSGAVWKLAAETAAHLSGDVDQDRGAIRSLLDASLRNQKQFERRLEAGELDAFNQDEEHSDRETVDTSGKSAGDAAGLSDTVTEVSGGSEPSANLTSKENGPKSEEGTPATMSPAKLAALRDHVLSIIAGFAPALKVPEVAAALLLAGAIERDRNALDRLLSIMKSRKSIVAVQVPVRDFERHFGHLLEDGLVMPSLCRSKRSLRVHLWSGATNRSPIQSAGSHSAVSLVLC